MRLNTLPMGMLPARPSSVPSEAWWVEQTKEWELGPAPAGEPRHGTYRWWRADGSFAAEASFENGVLHGSYVRHHPNGEPAETASYQHGKLHGTRTWHQSVDPSSEKAFVPSLPASIWRAENDCDLGEVVAMRFYDRDGRRVCATGEPFPQVPPGLPQTVMFDTREGVFVEARYTAETKPTGVWRLWTVDGVLRCDRDHTKTEVHERIFHPNGQVAAEGVIDPLRTGVWRFYDERGALLSEELWAAGKRVPSPEPAKPKKPPPKAKRSPAREKPHAKTKTKTKTRRKATTKPKRAKPKSARR